MPENPDLTKDLTGQANKFVRVKTDEKGYEFATISGGGDLLAANNLSDLVDDSAARTNLGVLAAPTGTPDGTKYLRDDNTWQPVSGGSGLEQYQIRRIIRR